VALAVAAGSQQRRGMHRLSTALFLLAAIVNLVPGIGVQSGARLESLYGVALEDPALVILMRHRAVLLAIVGGVLAAAAFRPALRPAAVAAGLVSMLSFVALAVGAGAGPALQRIAIVDVAASIALVAAARVGGVRKPPAGRGGIGPS
jgi:hypothetical protein